MSKETTIIYELVQNNEKKTSLFKELENYPSPLLLKVKNNAEVLVKPIGLSFSDELTAPLNPAWGAGNSGSVSVWFDDKNENYFLESTFRVVGPNILINLKGDLFQRQKRHDFRLFIPVFYKATFQVTQKNKKPFSTLAQVSDVNNSGLGLKLGTAEEIKTGDELEGLLQLGDHAPVSLACLVRHRQEQNGSVSVGCEIKHSVCNSEADHQKNILMLRYDVFHMNQAKAH